MSKHQTTVVIASYKDQKTAEADWEAVEHTAKEGNYLADSAVVVREADGTPKLVDRQSRHGWGKGAIAGAVVGILFPPSILLGAAVGAVAGAGVGRLHRSLGREKVKSLGDTLDKGEAAVIVVADTAAIDAFKASLSHAVEIHSESTGLTDDELQVAPAS